MDAKPDKGKWHIRIVKRSKSARKITGKKMPFYISIWKTPGRKGKENRDDGDKDDDKDKENDKEKHHWEFKFEKIEKEVNRREKFVSTQVVHGQTDDAHNNTRSFPYTQIDWDNLLNKKGKSLHSRIDEGGTYQPIRLSIETTPNDAGGENNYNVSIDGAPIGLRFNRYKITNPSVLTIINSSVTQKAANNKFDQCHGIKAVFKIRYKKTVTRKRLKITKTQI